jgi:hypothetical protein
MRVTVRGEGWRLELTLICVGVDPKGFRFDFPGSQAASCGHFKVKIAAVGSLTIVTDFQDSK